LDYHLVDRAGGGAWLLSRDRGDDIRRHGSPDV